MRLIYLVVSILLLAPSLVIFSSTAEAQTVAQAQPNSINVIGARPWFITNLGSNTLIKSNTSSSTLGTLVPWATNATAPGTYDGLGSPTFNELQDNTPGGAGSSCGVPTTGAFLYLSDASFTASNTAGIIDIPLAAPTYISSIVGSAAYFNPTASTAPGGLCFGFYGHLPGGGSAPWQFLGTSQITTRNTNQGIQVITTYLDSHNNTVPSYLDSLRVVPYESCCGGFLWFEVFDLEAISTSLTATVSVHACDYGGVHATYNQLPSCSNDLGVLPGVTVRLTAPANSIVYGVTTSGNDGSANLSFYIPSTQGGIIAAFTLFNLAGYAAETYYFALTSSFNGTLYADRALGYTFYQVSVHACGDASLQDTCTNDLGPVPGASYIASGAIVANGTADNSGVIALAVNTTGLVVIVVNVSGYNPAVKSFPNPGPTSITIYLQSPAVTCSPSPGNFTVPSQANLSVNVFQSSLFYAIFQLQGSGSPGITSSVYQLPQVSGAAGISTFITWPYGRPSSLSPYNDTGSYAVVFTDKNGAYVSACPFIIYSGTGAAPTQASADSSFQSVTQSTMQNTVASFALSQAAKNQVTETHDLILDAGTFAFRSDIYIPNLYLFLLLTMVVGIIMAATRRGGSS